ncbi:MAG: ATP synthase subunit I [Gammaproteobacteria bacterium]
MGNTHKFQKARQAVFRLTVWQLLLTAIVAGIAYLVFGTEFAFSATVGGLIGIVAGSYQAQRMLRVDAGKYPEAFMRGLWTSEVVKIVLTVALFILAIRLLQVQMVPTIVGYAATYVIYWVALGTRYPWFDSGHNNPRDQNWPDA